MSSTSGVSTAPLYFSGVSKFSSDLQTILTRAVNIASVPLHQIQNQQADLITRKQLLTDFNTSVSGLATIVDTLGSIGDSQGLTATSSNSTRVSVSLSSGATPGVHTITNITSVAKSASETTVSGFATSNSSAVASGSSLELAIGSKTYSIDTSSGKNNLESIRDQINALGVGVNASVVNTGTGNTPYYLSLTASKTGATTLELRNTAGDSSSNILTNTNQGADADFYFDGLHVVKHDNVVSDVLPGVSFSILSQTSGDSITLSLSSQRASLANALTSLVTQYNELGKKVTAQIGQNAGLLSGDAIVRTIQQEMHKIVNFTGTGSGSIQSLTDLGIELDRTGTMSFNQNTFYSLSNADLANAFTFLKSSTGLGKLADNLNSICDPVTGAIQLQQANYDAADQRLSKKAADLNQRINDMQSSLLSRLQAADSLLASLESQQTLLTASINSVNYATFGKISSS